MNKVIVVLAIVVGSLVGCAGARPATIHGNDLYARASELREQGEVSVPTSNHKTVVVHANQYLVDRSADQVFQVRDVVAGCYGNSLAEDTECTLALLRDHRFVVTDKYPEPRRVKGDESRDISDLNKARLVLLTAGTAMAIGAAKCDAFDGCQELLGIGAGLDALLLLVTMTGTR